jgi:UDP-3-O-[3-hydroxymyristoyl] glucosamine N-acyltransferase
MKHVSNRASLGSNVKIGEGSIIEDNVAIGDNVKIGYYTIIHENVIIGSNSFLGDHVVLGERTQAFYEDPQAYSNPTLRVGPNSIIRTGSILYAGTEIGSHLHTGSYALIRHNCHLGDRNLVGSYSEIHPDVKMGKCNRVLDWACIGHKTTIENYVWVGPYASTIPDMHPPCGRCLQGPTIEDFAVIGTSAILLPKIKIGSNAVVAAGSLVTKNVKANTLVRGSPARYVCDIKSIKCKEGLVKAPYPWRNSISKEKIRRYGYDWSKKQ